MRPYFGLEAFHEGGVGRVVEVLRPLAGVEHAEGRVADGAQNHLVEREGRADTGSSTPTSAYCLMKEMPMPPGRKKNTESASEARIWAISAA